VSTPGEVEECRQASMNVVQETIAHKTVHDHLPQRLVSDFQNRLTFKLDLK
jgi:hypothetical protein